MNLRNRLLVMTLGTLVPLIVVAALMVGLLVQNERESARRGASDRARAFMSAVDAELRGSIGTLQALAASGEVAAGDLATFHRRLAEVKESRPEWFGIALVRADGQQLVNPRVPFGSPLPRAVDTRAIDDVVRSRTPIVGNISPGPVNKTYQVPVRVPVVRGGEVPYVLVAGIDPDAFNKLIDQQNLKAGSVIGLVDRAGHFVARRPFRPPTDLASTDFRRETSAAVEGWYRGLTVDGTDTFTAFISSPLSGWVVGNAVPAEELDASARHAGMLIGGGVALALAVAFGFAWWMGRRFTQPIAALASSAHEMAEGRPFEAPATQIPEVAVLSRALADASHALAERHELMQREQAALKTADVAKDEFLAMLSHELRNPLAALTNASQVMRLAPADDPRAVRSREIVERQTQVMARLVEDLLDISRLTMGKETLRLEAFDLAEFAARVLEHWNQPGTALAGRARYTGSPAPIHADRARVEQMVTNLLGNAAKFSPPDAAIDVTVEAKDGEALLRVTDRGEGIEADLLPKVFGLFVQGAQDSHRSAGGMGIGLAVVKRLVEMHGGHVSAESEGRGKGTSVTLHFPLLT